MFGQSDSERSGAARATANDRFRWECRCQQTPVLLATYDDGGQIHIKARDRHWHILGSVQTRCPRCGAEHALDLRVGSGKSDVGRETAKRPPG